MTENLDKWRKEENMVRKIEDVIKIVKRITELGLITICSATENITSNEIKRETHQKVSINVYYCKW